MAKRCVAYCRVSTNQEKQKTSIESQKSYYSHKFEGDGFLPSQYGLLYKRDGTIKEIPSLYVDEGISGTCLTHRKAFEKMINDAKLGRFDIIYVKSVSRFARNTVDGLTACKELRSLGVGVVFEDCGLNSLDAENDMTLSVLFAVAQKESLTKSNNVKWGIRQRQKTGRYVASNPPFGYDYSPETKSYSINDRESELVRWIFNAYLNDDYSANGIAKYFNENLEEYPTKNGKQWSATIVRRILMNPLVIGEYHTHKEERESYEADSKTRVLSADEHYIFQKPELRIIDNDTFERVQVLLGKNREKYDKTALRNSNTNLFSGLIYCRGCGSAYYRKKRCNRDDYLWGCRNAILYGTKKCNHDNTSIAEVDLIEGVKAEIKSLQEDISTGGKKIEKLFKLYLQIVYEMGHANFDESEIRASMEKVQRKKAILLEDRAEGLMSKELYQKEVKALNDDLERLEASMTEFTMYSDRVADEWKRFKAYKKMVKSIDTENLSNGILKQVFDKMYVGLVNPENKRYSRRYIVFSYKILGYTVEELLLKGIEKGYIDKDTKITVNVN